MNTANIKNNIFVKIPIHEIWRENNSEDFEASLGLEYYEDQFFYYYYKVVDKNKFVYGIMKYNISFEQTVILQF